MNLWLAFIFFSAAFIFWVLCWLVRDRREKTLAFWYSVFFENAGFATLVVDGVTDS